MSVISSGRPIRKGETEEVEQWKKESAEKLLKMQQEWARKRVERANTKTSAST